MATTAEVRLQGLPAQQFLQTDQKAKRKTSYASLLVPAGLGHARVGKLAEGVMVLKAERVRTRAKLDEDAFSSIIGYSKVHYKRLQKATKKHLREGASNRLYRLAQVLDHAIELYDGDEETALRWLKAPNPAFGNQAPMIMLRSEVGADLVDRLISQLELGILPV